MRATLVAVRHQVQGASFTNQNGKFMSTRKKNADAQRQGQPQNNDKQEPQQSKRHSGSDGGPAQPNPTVRGLDLAVMLMIGDEHVVITGQEDDNISFMTEFIDP